MFIIKRYTVVKKNNNLVIPTRQNVVKLVGGGGGFEASLGWDKSQTSPEGETASPR